MCTQKNLDEQSHTAKIHCQLQLKRKYHQHYQILYVSNECDDNDKPQRMMSDTVCERERERVRNE